MTFYILINVDNYSEQLEKDITKALPNGVKHEYQSVYGVFDGIIKIFGKENVREISDKIRNISKIHSIMVLTVDQHG